MPLPPGLIAYKQTPVFDENTVPPALRREQRTKDNVWALVHVLEGVTRAARLNVSGLGPDRGDPFAQRNGNELWPII